MGLAHKEAVEVATRVIEGFADLFATASSVASFSFLSPVLGVALGWLLLGEHVGPQILLALVLVCAGLILINRPRKDRPR